MWIPLFAGATARTIAVTTFSPLELIRTKMQSKKLTYSGNIVLILLLQETSLFSCEFWHFLFAEITTALRQVVKYEGYKGLFRGLGSTLLRDVPFSGTEVFYDYIILNFYITILRSYLISNLLFLVSGIYWTTFETTKRIFNKPDSEKNSFLFNFFCGSVAGSVSELFTLPLYK